MLCATGTDPHCNPMIKTGFQYIIIAPPPLTPSQHVCITPLHELIVIEANAEFAIVQVDGVRGCACPLPPHFPSPPPPHLLLPPPSAPAYAHVPSQIRQHAALGAPSTFLAYFM
jgi:hypothetical protein